MNWRHATEPNLTTTIPDATPRGPAPSGGSGPPPLAPWRKAVLGTLFLVLVGGIVAVVVSRSSGDKSGAAAPVVSAPVHRTTVVTSAAQSDQPPALLNTGDDWTGMVRSFEAYLYWLARHPNPELLSNITHPLNPVFADSKNALAKFASGEWRYDPDPRPPIVDSVRFNGTIFDGSQALLFVTYGPADRYRIVDRAGNVVLDAPPTASRKVIMTLVHDPGDPHWRVLKGVRA